MKVALDTNVIVSGLLKPFGAPGEIIRMTSAGILEICYDARALAEYREVLLRPRFPFDEDHVDVLLEQIKGAGHNTVGQPLTKRLPDPTDEVFLEIALAAKARCLITGNLKHYPSDKRQGVKVLSPSEFLDFYRKND